MTKECEVLLYALTTCGHCKKTKQLLEDNNVDFQCVFVDKLVGDERKSTIEEMKEHNPRVSFPTLVVDQGDTVIVGFHKKDIEETLQLADKDDDEEEDS